MAITKIQKNEDLPQIEGHNIIGIFKGNITDLRTVTKDKNGKFTVKDLDTMKGWLKIPNKT